MAPEEERNENEIVGDQRRNGQPVIKTTIEIDKELYIRMKEEVARSNTSIRDFVSSAARERLTKDWQDEEADRPTKDLLQGNDFAKKVLAILRVEVPKPFDLALLVSKVELLKIDPYEFSASDLSDALIQELSRPVDFLSGPAAADAIKKALISLRRE